MDFFYSQAGGREGKGGEEQGPALPGEVCMGTSQSATSGLTDDAGRSLKAVSSALNGGLPWL